MNMIQSENEQCLKLVLRVCNNTREELANNGIIITEKQEHELKNKVVELVRALNNASASGVTKFFNDLEHYVTVHNDNYTLKNVSASDVTTFFNDLEHYFTVHNDNYTPKNVSHYNIYRMGLFSITFILLSWIIISSGYFL